MKNKGSLEECKRMLWDLFKATGLLEVYNAYRTFCEIVKSRVVKDEKVETENDKKTFLGSMAKSVADGAGNVKVKVIKTVARVRKTVAQVSKKDNKDRGIGSGS
ncbi:MAG: hypothetical protein IKQ31_02620 [Clostridia bacterium]|nr:hypothetical protein [Clostridia bacterium]